MTLDQNTPAGSSSLYAVVFVTNSSFSADSLQIRGNPAFSLVYSKTATLTNCAVYANSQVQFAIEASSLVLSSCTITGNQFQPNQSNVADGSNVQILNSIIWQGNTPSVSPILPTTNISDSIIQDTPDSSKFGTYKNVSHSNPLFVNPSGLDGNYALDNLSPAIDYTATCPQLTDLNGNLHGVSVKRSNTPCDIGAFERQLIPPNEISGGATEDFESIDPWALALPTEWSMKALADVRENWAVVAAFSPIPGFGTFSAHADDLGAVGEAVLTTPRLYFSRGSQLIFDQDFDLDSGHDGVILEISKDGATQWTDILKAGGSFATGGYNSTLACNGSFAKNPLLASCSDTTRVAWSGNTLGVSHVVVNLPADLPQGGIFFRWLIGSDGGIGRPGYTLDNVRFVTSDNIFSNNFEVCTDGRCM